MNATFLLEKTHLACSTLNFSIASPKLGLIPKQNHDQYKQLNPLQVQPVNYLPARRSVALCRGTLRYHVCPAVPRLQGNVSTPEPNPGSGLVE